MHIKRNGICWGKVLSKTNLTWTDLRMMNSKILQIYFLSLGYISIIVSLNLMSLCDHVLTITSVITCSTTKPNVAWLKLTNESSAWVIMLS